MHENIVKNRLRKRYLLKKMTLIDGKWRIMIFFDKWISDVIIGATIDWHVRKHYVLDYKGGVNYVQ